MALQQLTALGNLYRAGDATNQRGFARQAVNLANQQGIGLQEFAQSVGFDPETTMKALGDYGLSLNPVQQQQYGLSGAESAITEGRDNAINRIDQTQSMVGGLFDKGTSQITPFIEPGQQANQLQAALSGALGPEAQAQAFANYNQSPGVQFAQQEAERAITRNQAALGGLSGGNVQDELARRAAGTFAQDFSNQFGMLGDVATRGLSAAGTYGGLQGQQAGIQSGLGQTAAGFDFTAGMAIGDMRNQAGRDISAGVGQTSSALAQLLNQQGAGTADIVGQGTNNIQSLIQQASAGDAAAKQQLGQILGNLSVQQGSGLASVPFVPGQQPNNLNQFSQLVGGLGGLLQSLPNSQAQPAANPSGSILPQGPYSPTYGGYGGPSAGQGGGLNSLYFNGFGAQLGGQ